MPRRRPGADPRAATPGRAARRGLIAAALLAAALPGGAAAAPPPCEPPQGFAPQGRLESAEVVVLFRAVPAPIEVGRHFAVEAIVCPAPQAGPAGGLAVDARMPEHRHGMNYRPRVAGQGGGRYVAEGLLFHMPGRWQLVFDVERGGRTERLSADIELE